MANKKSPLILEDEKEKTEFKIDPEIEQQAEKETTEEIPSNFIPIKLPSNGRIKGIPKVLHFRDYSASESLDINPPNEEDSPKAICRVLKGMCYEHFDIKELPIQDVIYIIFVLQATFISNELTKTIYIDDKLPPEEIDRDDNIEEVSIPLNKLQVTYLGKDKKDKDLPEKIKIPFKVKDKRNNDTIEFKFASLEDTILAQNYCNDFYSDDFLNFSSIRKDISEIQRISNNEQRRKKMDSYMREHFEECKKYYTFMNVYTLMLGKVIQALQIVSFNGEKLESLSDKWKVYSEKLSSSCWEIYNNVVEKFTFGLNEDVEVFSNKLGKKVVRKIPFQPTDFLSFNNSKVDERYSVLFE